MRPQHLDQFLRQRMRTLRLHIHAHNRQHHPRRRTTRLRHIEHERVRRLANAIHPHGDIDKVLVRQRRNEVHLGVNARIPQGPAEIARVPIVAASAEELELRRLNMAEDGGIVNPPRGIAVEETDAALPDEWRRHAALPKAGAVRLIGDEAIVRIDSKRFKLPVALGLVSFTIANLAWAGDWPRFLGPLRNGVYEAADAPATLQTAWKQDAGEGFAGPVVAAGKLILFHRKNNREIIDCLDARTGKAVWSSAYPTAYRDDFGFDEGPRATPVIDSGRVFTFGAEGKLTATDFATGKQLWQIDVIARYKVKKGYFGAAGAPVVDDNRVIVNAGGPEAGIVAFDAATGKQLWTATSDEASYSSGTIATIHGKKLAIFFTRNGLAALDPATGAVRYSMKWRARNAASVNAATPLVSGNQVFLSSSYETGAILLDATASGDWKKVWSSDDAISNHYSTCVLKDGYLYGFHGRQEQGQTLRAVEWKTGKVAWEVEGLRAGTVTLLHDRLMVLTENGEMRIGAASPKGFKPDVKKRVVDGLVRAYPAVADGMIYVRGDRGLIALK